MATRQLYGGTAERAASCLCAELIPFLSLMNEQNYTWHAATRRVHHGNILAEFGKPGLLINVATICRILSTWKPHRVTQMKTRQDASVIINS